MSTIGLVNTAQVDAGPVTTYTYDPSGTRSVSGTANNRLFLFEGGERLSGIGASTVADRNSVMLNHLRFWVLTFAALGTVLGVAAFMVGIAFSGYRSVFGPAIIVSYLALWPYMLLQCVIPEHLLRSFFDKVPFAYFPGLPLIGWGLLGVPLGWWRGRRAIARGS